MALPRLSRSAPGPLAALAALLSVCTLSSCGETICATDSSGTWTGVVVDFDSVVAPSRSQHLVARLCVDDQCVSKPITPDVSGLFNNASAVKSGAPVTSTLVIKTRSGRTVFSGSVTAAADAPNVCRSSWELNLVALGHHRLRVVRVGGG